MAQQAAVAEWRVVGPVFVFFGDGGEFAEDDFTRWLADLDKSGCTKYVGGTGASFALSSKTRNLGTQFFSARRIPFLTVTDSLLVRGFVTAAQWVGLDVAAHSWADLEGGLEWLKLDGKLATEVTAALLWLRGRVELRLREGAARQAT
jgi:hypothetical protein